MERLTYKAQGNCGFIWALKCPHGSIQDAIDRLASYEDTGLEPQEIAVLCSMHERAKMAELMRNQENSTLTLEELRKMDGEPVWIETPGVREYGRYAIVEGVDIDSKSLFLRNDFTCHNYGKAWLAYRRKPEEAVP